MAIGDKLVNLDDLKVVYDELKDYAVRDMIAPTEANTTASVAYSKGSYFILDDVLYQAALDIVAGGTIYTSGINQNCEAVPRGISEQVTSFEELAMQASTTPSLSAEKFLSFQDGADGASIRNAVIHFGIAQGGSGTPSAENVRTIRNTDWLKTIVSGKNLFGGQALKDVFKKRYPSSITWSESNRTLSGSAGNWSGKIICNSQDNIFKPNTRYTIIFTLKNSYDNATNFQISYTDGSSDTFGRVGTGSTNKGTVVVVTKANKTVSRISGRNSGGTTYLYVDESGIFEGVLSATDFEAFKGAAYISDLSENVTVAEGTWDVLAGTFTTEYGFIESYNGETLPGEWVSNMAEYIEGTTPPIGSQVAYKLEEPALYNVTPQNMHTVDGENHVSGWTDGNDLIAIEYIADTQKYIDNQINAAKRSVQQAIAPVENEDTASQPYTQGAFFFHNDNFCKAKTDIASGATFTLDTNYEVTTVAAVLIALQS